MPLGKHPPTYRPGMAPLLTLMLRALHASGFSPAQIAEICNASNLQRIRGQEVRPLLTEKRTLRVLEAQSFAGYQWTNAYGGQIHPNGIFHDVPGDAESNAYTLVLFLRGQWNELGDAVERALNLNQYPKLPPQLRNTPVPEDSMTLFTSPAPSTPENKARKSLPPAPKDNEKVGREIIALTKRVLQQHPDKYSCAADIHLDMDAYLERCGYPNRLKQLSNCPGMSRFRNSPPRRPPISGTYLQLLRCINESGDLPRDEMDFPEVAQIIAAEAEAAQKPSTDATAERDGRAAARRGVYHALRTWGLGSMPQVARAIEQNTSVTDGHIFLTKLRKSNLFDRERKDREFTEALRTLGEWETLLPEQPRGVTPEMTALELVWWLIPHTNESYNDLHCELRRELRRAGTTGTSFTTLLEQQHHVSGDPTFEALLVRTRPYLPEGLHQAQLIEDHPAAQGRNAEEVRSETPAASAPEAVNAAEGLNVPEPANAAEGVKAPEPAGLERAEEELFEIHEEQGRIFTRSADLLRRHGLVLKRLTQARDIQTLARHIITEAPELRVEDVIQAFNPSSETRLSTEAMHLVATATSCAVIRWMEEQELNHLF